MALDRWLGRRLLSRPSAGGRDGAAAPRAAAAFAAELRFDKVGCRFGDRVVLDAVDLTLAPGEIVCLLGPSGSGKTTLLRIASGVEAPTSGRVLIDGQPVAGPGVFVPPERRGVGLMFQDFALFPHLSVEDNVAFGLRQVPIDDARRAAMGLLARVGLAHQAQAKPQTLSGGEQQRVALARAMLPRPAVMLMDEPFSGLDVQLRETVQSETLRLLRETRATCLMVTHSPDEAMRMGDRIAVMRDGRIVQVGRAEELYRHPIDLFVARLFSEINEIPLVVTEGALRTPFGTFGSADLAEGDAAVLCIRRRALRFTDWKPDPGAAGVAGRVLDVRFLGDSVAMDVAVDGFDHALTLLSREDRARPRGADLRLTVDPAGVLIFKDERT
jgi:iron(III) transport system ATP-binding protein